MATQKLSLFRQLAGLKQILSGSTGTIKMNRLRWTGHVTPTELSATYKLKVEYSLEKSPKVFVSDPPLKRRKGKRAEHLYANGALCLYLPDAGEWTPDMLIAETLIPWASEWLLHYELWLATGEWHGGGIHPNRGK